jgi:GTP diphosphokinase / guanosine-3',5'-bis(diphosphate) 3'-diphosphatase
MTIDLTPLNEGKDYWLELKKSLAEEYDLELIKRAFDFAVLAHGDQKRESGEPYISHPVWIAKVIAQLGVGQEAILVALLHDCVEDTKVKLEDISDEFGDEVALLVEGMTEIKKADKGVVVHQTNLDVFRKFLFSSVNDVRILIIRIVDKLHNGLTIDALPRKRQIKYAQRVFGVYGPVSEYVGLHYFKRLLEDIAFKILYPKESKRLQKLLQERNREEKRALTLVKNNINELLKTNKINNYDIQSRIKSLYSTYIRSKRRNDSDAMLDRVGIRVITQNVADCYTVLGLLHASYEYLPEEFNDYISAPKPNGYRSIQTTINWRNKLTVEVQIRTKEMQEFNEFGPASHVAYKMSKGGTGSKGYEWVKDLVRWQKSDNDIKNYTIKVLEKFIYVFTPKGDTIQLPVESTALDFAYRIHTDIGDHCGGVKINQKMAKIDTILKTGDYVEILTNKRSNVNKNWLFFVKTPWAREHIRKMVNSLGK